MVLFRVPIATGGSFEVTEPQPKVYLIAWDSPPDNRLTTSFNEAFLVALDLVEHNCPKGVVVTTSKITKFYSNGLQLSDLGHPQARTKFMGHSFQPLLLRLLTFPMPTVALINGHAFAGGLIIAMHQDYRIQNPSRGYLCMNEVQLGAFMDPPLIGIFRAKVASPATFRALILEGYRFNSKEAIEQGLTDGLGGFDEVLKLIQDKNLISMGEKGVYGGLKEEIYREQVGLLRRSETSAEWAGRSNSGREDAAAEQVERLDKWKSKVSGSKL